MRPLQSVHVDGFVIIRVCSFKAHASIRSEVPQTLAELPHCMPAKCNRISKGRVNSISHLNSVRLHIFGNLEKMISSFIA